MKDRLNRLYQWFLYYPYILFFTVFEPKNVEETENSVGTVESGSSVYAISADAQMKLFSKFIVHKYLLVCREEDNTWCARFITEEDFFAYKVGVIEKEPITNLIKLRLV